MENFFLLEITTKSISKNEAPKRCNDLIKPDADLLTYAKFKGKNKRNNILNILDNIESSLFHGLYFHYKDVPKRSIAERVKLRRPRLDEVKKIEENINNDLFSHYFNYSSPNNKRSRLGNAKGEINKDQVYLIKKALTKFKNIVKNVPEDRTFKIQENEKIIDIVPRIAELNNENQLGEALKILKPDQMLSRLPVTLAQLKAEFTKTYK